MQVKVYTIEINLPRRVKHALVGLGIPLFLFIGTIGLVRADVVTIPHVFKTDDILSASEMNENFTVLANAVNQAAPTGTIVAYYGTSAPSGWLIANGTTIDKNSNSDYTALVDHLRALNTAQGTSNPTNANQAVLPDLLGQFLRGQDRGAGMNPDCGDDLIGQEQGDQLASHVHNLFRSDVAAAGTNRAIPNVSGNDVAANLVESSGGSETRPKNVTVLYIIKW